jgi:hypothetical protein
MTINGQYHKKLNAVYSILEYDEQLTNLNFWLTNFSFCILKEDDVKSNSKLNFDFFRRRLSYAVWLACARSSPVCRVE